MSNRFVLHPVLESVTKSYNFFFKREYVDLF